MTNKDLLNFIENNRGVLTLIGVLFAIIAYFSDLLTQSEFSPENQINFGYAIIILYGLVLVLIFLLVREAYKKYNLFSFMFASLILISGLFLFSYITSKFPEQIALVWTFVTIIVSFVLSFYTIQKIMMNLKKQTRQAQKALFILSVFILVFVFSGWDRVLHIPPAGFWRYIFYGAKLFFGLTSLIAVLSCIMQLIAFFKKKSKKRGRRAGKNQKRKRS